MSKNTAFNAETTPRHTFLCSDSQCLPPGDPRILCAKHGYPITGKSFIAVISFDLVRSSVSVAMQEDYVIFFSGEGERGVERRVKTMPVTADIGSNVWSKSYCRLL